MTELTEIMSEKKASDYLKNYHAVAEYIKRFYDCEEYLFNFEDNDLVETRSGTGNYFDEHCPHVTTHINPGIKWAVGKIATAMAEKRGIKDAKSGTTHPTWFESKEQASEALERILISSNNVKILKKIQNWCNDRDIYYNDRKNNRLVINIRSNMPVGLGIVKGTDYNTPFEAHGLHVVLEYTVSKADGEFAVYDLYPYFTEEDWKTINSKR